MIQKEFKVYYKECFEETKEKLKEEEYYKDNPQKLTNDAVKTRMNRIGVGYLLSSNARNIESSNIQSFVEAEWPNKFEEISLAFGSSK